MKPILALFVFGVALVGCARTSSSRPQATVEPATETSMATVTAIPSRTPTLPATVALTATPVATIAQRFQLEPEITDRTGLCHKNGELPVGDVDSPTLVKIFFESEDLCLKKILQSSVTLALVSALDLNDYRMLKKQLECWIEWRNALDLNNGQQPEVDISYRFFWGPSIRGVPADDLATHPCDPDYRWVQ